ncbi:hypothetical protein M0Q50_10755 [bacterium]|jgi:hypothetical protein|nr:hypothetical protein [bacterium]
MTTNSILTQEDLRNLDPNLTVILVLNDGNRIIGKFKGITEKDEIDIETFVKEKKKKQHKTLLSDLKYFLID